MTNQNPKSREEELFEIITNYVKWDNTSGQQKVYLYGNPQSLRDDIIVLFQAQESKTRREILSRVKSEYQKYHHQLDTDGFMAMVEAKTKPPNGSF